MAVLLWASLVPKIGCRWPIYSSSWLPISRILVSSARFPSPRRPRLLHMAASAVSRTNLGLTHPSDQTPPEIIFSAKETDFAEWKGDILAVGVTEKDMSKDEKGIFQNATLRILDSKLGGLLTEASKEEDFTGKVGQTTVLRLPGLPFRRLGLVGLGQSASSLTVSTYKGLGEAVATTAKASQATNVAVVLASYDGLSADVKLNAVSSIASGTVLGVYEDNRFKSESKTPSLKSVDVIGFGSGPEFEKKLKYAVDVSIGVILARELVNSPANVLTPIALAEEALKIASTFSDVFTATILDVDQCRELKMGSYLGVAAASANPPRFIHVCYKPPGGDVKVKLAIVGKGLTFDSGGYNIKTGPGCSIELMKFDMGGSAAALGAAKAIGQIKPRGVEVHFIVAACENMISGTGMRPGDIVTASNGKTIEVNNTDAEGRLTLADALVYACNQGVQKVVDLATLTGACIIALGGNVAADWWSSFGHETPELATFAMRILNLTCSASGCERNWSTFSMVHSKRRNKLEQQKMNALVFVMYNMKLKERHLKRSANQDPISLDHIDSDDEWIMEKENPLLPDQPNWLVDDSLLNLNENLDIGGVQAPRVPKEASSSKKTSITYKRKGVFTPSDDLASEVLTSAAITGEKFWRLPLEESYWESMKSGVADMVNTGGRQGGAINAALFLKQFVDEKVQWLHIDMAGPVWNEKKRGATGFAVSTLVEWVRKNSS